jgi:hypothetical protein
MRTRTPRLALFAHSVERLAQDADALLNATPVNFKFRFTWTTRADAATQTREIGTNTNQIRLPITQLRELHLQLTLAATGMFGKHIEDQHRAIHDRHRNNLLQILALTRPQIVEHEHQLDILVANDARDFTRFPRADQGSRINAIALLHDAFYDLRACRFSKRFEFDELGVERSLYVADVDSDDNCWISQRSPSL